MTAADLLTDLRRRDVVVAAEGVSLHVDAPRGVLTSEIRHQLADHKDRLLRLLHLEAEIAQMGDGATPPSFPADLLEAVFLLRDRLGGEIVSVERLQEPVEQPQLVDAPPSTCFACKGTHLWRSVHGSVVCGDCHPPATEDLVAAWIDADTQQAAKERL